MDFIHISDRFGDPCYKIGSSKLMDFCLKVGTEIETLFREILNDKKFDSYPAIDIKRNYQNIDVYKKIIEPKYELRRYSLFVKPIKVEIFPFINFDSQTPEWFKISSKSLKEYTKNREIKELNKKIREFEDFKGEAKGIIIELVNAYIFSKLGFQVYWSLKGKYTEYKEIDLVIFKKFRKRIIFYIIEMSTSKSNLIQEINQKIEILKKNSLNLLKFFNLVQDFLCKFKGIAITSNKTNLQADKNVKIINFKDMINNLKNLRIDKRRLLKIVDS